MKLTTNKHDHRWTWCYLGTAFNTSEARELVKCLRILVRPYGRICLKGRNPNRQQFLGVQGLTKYQLSRNLRLSMSTRFDVYFYPNFYSVGIPHKVKQYSQLPLEILKAWVIIKRA